MRDPYCVHCGEYIKSFGKGYKLSLIKIKGKWCHERCYSIYMSPEQKRLRYNAAARNWKYRHGVKPRKPKLTYRELMDRRHDRYIINRDKILDEHRQRWYNRTPEQRQRTRELARLSYHKRRDKVRETDYQFKVKIL